MRFDPKKPNDSMTQVRDFNAPAPIPGARVGGGVEEGGETMRRDPSNSAPRQAYQPPDELVADDRFDVRYEPGEKLGQGGMGVVRTCVDRRIGREIAMKIARTDTASPSYSDTRAR